MQRLFYFVFGFVGLLVVGNLLLLDYFLVQQRNELVDLKGRTGTLAESFKLIGSRLYTTSASPSGANTAPKLAPIPLTDLSCPTSCVSLIRSATASIRTTVLAPAPAPSPTPAPAPQSTGGEFFVPLGNGSISAGSDWADVNTAQATFDAGSYGTIKNAYFEVFMKISSGEVSARLFDSTTPAIFWGSEVKTSSAATQFLSAPVTLSKGTKTYKVQMKSTISTGVLDQARIRIVAQ